MDWKPEAMGEQPQGDLLRVEVKLDALAVRLREIYDLLNKTESQIPF